MKKPYVVAEIGSNWKRSDLPAPLNGMTFALNQIKYAAETGADAVKFQLFTSIELYGYPVPSVDKYAIPKEWINGIQEYAKKCNVDFLCSAFSEEGYKFIDKFVDRHKVASCELPHLGILETLVKLKKPVILSIGGAKASEIQKALYVLRDIPTAVMHCVSAYPAKEENYELGTIEMLKLLGNMDIGLSDHTLTKSCALLSLGKGVTIFEKHFDYYKNNIMYHETPDTPHSVDYTDFKSYVKAINDGYKLLQSQKLLINEQEVIKKHKRRLKIIKDLNEGDKLVYGENYGIFRSIDDDCYADSGFNYHSYNGKILRISKRQGDGLYIKDLKNA